MNYSGLNIEGLVSEWIYQYDAWNHKSEASKALISAIYHYIDSYPKAVKAEAKTYIEFEKQESEKYRKSIQQDIEDAAMNIK